MKLAIAGGPLVAAVLLAEVARAEGPRADQLFEEGRTLVLAKRYDEACPKLAASLALSRGIGTMLWLRDCLEKSGDLDGAWVKFREAATLAAAKRDPRSSVAERRATLLHDRVARVLVQIASDPSGAPLDVTCDGVPVPPEAVGNERPISSGFHTFAAAAPGRRHWMATVEIVPRPSAVVVNVPLLAVATDTAAPQRVGPPPGPPAAQRPGAVVVPPSRVSPLPPPRLSPLRQGALVAAGLGVVGVGAGTYLGLHAKSVYDASGADGHCDAGNVCDARGRELRSEARSLALVSTVAFGAGAAALGTGAVLWLLGAPAKPRSGIAPLVGPGTAGLVLERRW